MDKPIYKKWICIGLFLIGTCSVQAQDLVSDFLAKTKENKVFTQVNISSRMFQMISEITDAETESIIRNLTGMKMLTTEQAGIFRKYGRCFRSESLNMRN